MLSNLGYQGIALHDHRELSERWSHVPVLHNSTHADITCPQERIASLRTIPDLAFEEFTKIDQPLKNHGKVLPLPEDDCGATLSEGGQAYVSKTLKGDKHAQRVLKPAFELPTERIKRFCSLLLLSPPGFEKELSTLELKRTVNLFSRDLEGPPRIHVVRSKQVLEKALEENASLLMVLFHGEVVEATLKAHDFIVPSSHSVLDFLRSDTLLGSGLLEAAIMPKHHFTQRLDTCSCFLDLLRTLIEPPKVIEVANGKDSLKQLADMAKLSRQSLNGIEHGTVNATLDTLGRLMDVLGLALDV